MRAKVLVSVLSISIGLATVAVAPAVRAGSGSVSSISGGAATLTVPDVVTLVGRDCVDVPVSASFTGNPGYSAVQIYIAKPGAAPTIVGTVGTFTVGSSSASDVMRVCPSDLGAGDFNIYPTLLDSAGFTTSTTPIPISIKGGPTSATVVARAKGSSVTIAGKATTIGRFGVEGAQGVFRAFIKVPKSGGGSGKWKELGSLFPDEFGKFSGTWTVEGRPKGASVRVDVTCNDGYCAPASITGKVK